MSIPPPPADPRREPTLSIVVPLYNERFLVGELLSRLMELSLPGIGGIEILVVDDGSVDGSIEIVERLVASHPERIRFLRHEKNQGKGAALVTGIEAASGDLIVFQDADLEYDPRDLARMVVPFLEDGADVVYGSRFLAGARRRILYYRHELGNRFITLISNLFTNLNLSDVETCYKMFRGPLLKSIPLRSRDFAVEIEVTAKIAKRQCVIYEVPISYRGRSYQEGKKIGWRDGVKALTTAVRFWAVHDLYKDDNYGGAILHNLERAQRFNRWITGAVGPWIGARVLEIGAGIGNQTSYLLPRERYVVTDVNRDYLAYLENLALGKPYMSVARLDLDVEADFRALDQTFDTAVCLNVFEHVADPVTALRNVASVLQPGGRLVLYVPQGPGLFSSLDEVLGHERRYTRAAISEEVAAAGFELEAIEDFNRISVPAWWWNGKVLRRRHFGRVQLKLFDLLVPLLRRTDRLLPWRGLGLIVVGRKPG